MKKCKHDFFCEEYREIPVCKHCGKSAYVIIQAEQQSHNALREKLKELEWSNRGMCPCCKEVKYHDKDCWLNAELQAIKEMTANE